MLWHSPGNRSYWTSAAAGERSSKTVNGACARIRKQAKVNVDVLWPRFMTPLPYNGFNLESQPSNFTIAYDMPFGGGLRISEQHDVEEFRK